MANISSITESWTGHTFKEVETHIKGNYMTLTGVSVSSISSGVSSVLTLNSSNAVKKTSLSDLASLLGGLKYTNVSLPYNQKVYLHSRSSCMCEVVYWGSCNKRVVYIANDNKITTLFQSEDFDWYAEIGCDDNGLYLKKIFQGGEIDAKYFVVE